jgi:hypothetical protein
VVSRPVENCPSLSDNRRGEKGWHVTVERWWGLWHGLSDVLIPQVQPFGLHFWSHSHCREAPNKSHATGSPANQPFRWPGSLPCLPKPPASPLADWGAGLIFEEQVETFPFLIKAIHLHRKGDLPMAAPTTALNASAQLLSSLRARLLSLSLSLELAKCKTRDSLMTGGRGARL